MAQKVITRIASEIVGSVIRFAFPTGNDPEGRPTFYRVVCDVDALPPAIQEYGRIHGIKQKLVDAMAIGVYTDDKGRVRRPTLADKAQALVAMRDQLQGNCWNQEREGPTGGLLYNAMARLFEGKWADASEFSTWLDEQTVAACAKAGKDVKRSVVEDALRRTPKIAATIEAIRAEMGKATVDVDDILDGLETFEAE